MVMVLVCIGAGLWFEHRFSRSELRAQAAQHLFQHVITPDAQPIANHLNIGVAISDLPCQPGELLWARCRDLNERLVLAGNAHDRAVIEHEAIAITQRGRLRQVEQEMCTAAPLQHDAAKVAFVGSKLHAIYHSRLVE